MSTKKKKRIRKTSQITVLNDGVIVNSMESNSAKDAPSINAVNRSFLNKNTGGTISGNLVLTNNKTIKGNTLAGRSLTILCIYSDNNVLVGSPELSMKIRSATVPIWESGSVKKKLLVEGDAALGDTLPVGSGFLYTGEEPIPDNYEVTTPPFSNPNLLINGDFQVWQRGTKFNNFANKYTADRWFVTQATSASTIIQRSSDVPTNSPFLYSMKITDTTQGNGHLRYLLEDNLKKGETYTLSFWIKTTSDFASRILGNSELNKSFASTNGLWKRVEWTFTPNMDLNGVELLTAFSGEAYITGAKLEFGEIATPLVPRSYAQELMECQYYYEYIDNMLFVVAGDKTYEHYQYYSCTTDFKVKKRINPSFKCGKVTENASGKVISLANAFSNQNRITNIQLTSISTDLGVLISDVEIDAEIY